MTGTCLLPPVPGHSAGQGRLDGRWCWSITVAGVPWLLCQTLGTGVRDTKRQGVCHLCHRSPEQQGQTALFLCGKFYPSSLACPESDLRPLTAWLCSTHTRLCLVPLCVHFRLFLGSLCTLGWFGGSVSWARWRQMARVLSRSSGGGGGNRLKGVGDVL